ncbi:hypothetical protein D3C86_1176400 [compost metagenome]
MGTLTPSFSTVPVCFHWKEPLRVKKTRAPGAVLSATAKNPSPTMLRWVEVALASCSRLGFEAAGEIR